MLLIHTALQQEAQPLVEHFKLKKDTTWAPFPWYRSDSVQLVVSGIGKVNAASCISALLATQDLTQTALVSIGFAGAREKIQIGELIYINRILDTGAQRSFYPDILIRHKLNEGCLATFDQAVESENILDTGIDLVDMEASATFQSACRFMTPDRIAILKIVSDHLQCGVLTKEFSRQLLEKNLNDILTFVDSFRSFCQDQPLSLAEADYAIVSEVSAALRLTSAQQKILSSRVAMFRVNGGESLAALQNYRDFTVTSKPEAKKIFGEVLDVLTIA